METCCALLVELTAVSGKPRPVGVTLTVRTPASPLPASATVWGLPTALSVIVRAPVRLPAAVGEKLTVRPQDCPGERSIGTFPHEKGESEKSALTLILEIVARTLPVLIMVKFW